MTAVRVQITPHPDGGQRIVLDGLDISTLVSAIEVLMTPDARPQVRLTLVPNTQELSLDLPADTQALVQSLMPPQDTDA